MSRLNPVRLVYLFIYSYKIHGMINALEKFALIDKKPFLGICVGMQLLASESEENGKHEGLNWIQGKIKKLPNIKKSTNIR